MRTNRIKCEKRLRFHMKQQAWQVRSPQAPLDHRNGGGSVTFRYDTRDSGRLHEHATALTISHSLGLTQSPWGNRINPPDIGQTKHRSLILSPHVPHCLDAVQDRVRDLAVRPNQPGHGLAHHLRLCPRRQVVVQLRHRIHHLQAWTSRGKCCSVSPSRSSCGDLQQVRAPVLRMPR